MAESVKDASKYGPDDVDPAAALFFSTLIIVSCPNPFPPPPTLLLSLPLAKPLLSCLPSFQHQDTEVPGCMTVGCKAGASSFIDPLPHCDFPRSPDQDITLLLSIVRNSSVLTMRPGLLHCP